MSSRAQAFLRSGGPSTSLARNRPVLENLTFIAKTFECIFLHTPPAARFYLSCTLPLPTNPSTSTALGGPWRTLRTNVRGHPDVNLHSNDRETSLPHPAHHAHAHTHAHIQSRALPSHASRRRFPVCRFPVLQHLPRNSPEAQEAPGAGALPTRISGATMDATSFEQQCRLM